MARSFLVVTSLMAKGWMMGVQFEELFKEGLYLELGRKGVAMAQILKDVFEKQASRFWRRHLPIRYSPFCRMLWQKP
mgnify:CR=1 FL=1